MRQERWRTDNDEGRSRVKIIAQSVQFLSSGEKRERPEDHGESDTSDFAGGSEEEGAIPF